MARRKKLTAKQRRAGFGGRRAMGGGRRTTRRKAAGRRTPKTRTRTVTKYRTRTVARKAPRRRRSGGGGGGGKFLGLPMPGIDIQTAAFVAGGMLGYRIVPGLLAKVWPGMPQLGLTGYAVKAVGVLGLGMAASMLVAKPRAAQVVVGGLAILMYDAFNEYLAPTLGLSGLSGDLATVGDLSGIIRLPTSRVTSIPRMYSNSRAERDAVYAA